MKDTKRLLSDGQVWNAIDRLRDLLHQNKKSMTPEEWKNYCNHLQNDTSIAGIVYRCPYTSRAHSKPRGYAGDAVMMDYIYGHYYYSLLSSTDEFAEEVFRFTTNSAAARAVRHRRRMIAKHIDDTCKSIPDCRILSVACGHFREAEVSACIRNKFFGSVTVIDQDSESLSSVNKDYGHLGITVINRSVIDIISGKLHLGEYDLIYSAGLYDYLDTRLAQRLTSILANRLTIGGRILLANFVPLHEDVGFMEAIMDWNLIYRTPDEMRELLINSGCDEVDTFNDPSASIVYAVGKKLE